MFSLCKLFLDTRHQRPYNQGKGRCYIVTFGERLKMFREQRGLTQEQLAEKIGVAKSTVTGYEKGNRTPDVAKIKKLAAALEVSGDELLDTGYGTAERPTPVSESGPISPERQALLDAVKDMDNETAKAVLEVIRSVKRLRAE